MSDILYMPQKSLQDDPTNQAVKYRNTPDQGWSPTPDLEATYEFINFINFNNF